MKVTLPHRIPEARTPETPSRVHHGLSQATTSRWLCAYHSAVRMADNTTTRLIQMRIFDSDATGARTNPSRTLFRTETDNVSGNCA